MDAAFATLRDMVNSATLADEVRRTVLWCLDQLQGRYRQLVETCDTWHSDEIVRLVQGMLYSARRELTHLSNRGESS
jgi:hypothetical protein